MLIKGRINFRKRQRNISLFCLLMAMMIITNACVAGSTVTQSPSPLSPDFELLLTGKRWLIDEVTFRNEPTQLDILQPFELWFDQAGTLNFSSATCAGGAFLIFFENEHRYRLTKGEVAPQDCGELRNKQFARVLDALKITTQYEIQDNQLLLAGDDVRIVLSIHNAQ
ncbi:MAG: hypothetical protein DYG89_01160 [Caldilinea sp. CFX5]|nr:hypothetical protein [Caldilinea sp. CFX5]